jgi:hypothetical protein
MEYKKCAMKWAVIVDFQRASNAAIKLQCQKNGSGRNLIARVLHNPTVGPTAWGKTRSKPEHRNIKHALNFQRAL